MRHANTGGFETRPYTFTVDLERLRCAGTGGFETRPYTSEPASAEVPVRALPSHRPADMGLAPFQADGFQGLSLTDADSRTLEFLAHLLVFAGGRKAGFLV